MKKIAGILISILMLTCLHAQNPVQRADTVIHPATTDSVDFKSQPLIDSASQRKDILMNKDAQPIDDRKPPRPPKLK